MRKSTWRALLILALLVPLSRFSFADDTFAVGGAISDSGDVEGASMTVPGLYFNDEGSTWEAGDGVTWAYFHNQWPIGTEESAVISFSAGIFTDWTFDGVTGSYSFGTFSADTDPCIVGVSGCDDVPLTWTGELDLSDGLGTTLFEIQMTGTGTAFFSGDSAPDGFEVVAANADLTGEGEVVYAAPSVPEPSTLTLMMTALIASILAMRFRRTTATQN